MIYINLAPKSYVEKIYTNLFISKVIFVFLLLILVLISVSIVHYSKLKSFETEYSVLEGEYKLLQVEVEKAKNIEKQINEINNYIAAVEKINKNRFFYVAFMQDIINNLPPTCWFGGIDTKKAGDLIEVTVNLNSNSLEDMMWWYSFLEKNTKRYSSLKISEIIYNGEYYTTRLTFKYGYNI
jgi:Tfp pilus assembly protein PilN